jgi:hypothetical protein
MASNTLQWSPEPARLQVDAVAADLAHLVDPAQREALQRLRRSKKRLQLQRNAATRLHPHRLPLEHPRQTTIRSFSSIRCSEDQKIRLDSLP